MKLDTHFWIGLPYERTSKYHKNIKHLIMSLKSSSYLAYLFIFLGDETYMEISKKCVSSPEYHSFKRTVWNFTGESCITWITIKNMLQNQTSAILAYYWIPLSDTDSPMLIVILGFSLKTNIQHSLIDQFALMPVEIYNIFIAKNIFKSLSSRSCYHSFH